MEEKVYKVNTNDAFNNKYISEESNKKAKQKNIYDELIKSVFGAEITVETRDNEKYSYLSEDAKKQIKSVISKFDAIVTGALNAAAPAGQD